MSDDLQKPERPEDLGHLLVKLLDSMAQASDPDVKKLRPDIISFINDLGGIYERKGAEAAKAAAEERMPVFELATCVILLKTSRKMRDQLVMQSRKLGTTSAAGKQAREAANTFGELTEALDLLFAGAKKNDAHLRAEAHDQLARVSKKFENLAR